MNAPPVVKKCRKCKKDKTNYRHNKYSPDRLHDVCTDCDYDSYLKHSRMHKGFLGNRVWQ